MRIMSGMGGLAMNNGLKSELFKNQLVILIITFASYLFSNLQIATQSNCDKLLKLLVLNYISNCIVAQRYQLRYSYNLINSKNGQIRSQQLSLTKCRVQRLNVCGLTHQCVSLRYSLVYTEMYSSNVFQLNELYYLYLYICSQILLVNHLNLINKL